MTALIRTALAFLVLAAAGVPACPQATAPAKPPLLGGSHLWLKAGQMDLDDDADREWGIDREAYLALEGFVGRGDNWYWGGEFGRSRVGQATNGAGDRIQDLDFLWLELNGKKAFDFGHGLALDLGLGPSLFYVDGEEVSAVGGQEFTDPLADVGFGAQGFVDLTWRARRLLLGVDAKYQWAFDIFNIDYSNLRLGVHLGIAF